MQDYSNAFQAAAEVSMVTTSDPNDTSLTATVQHPIGLVAELKKLEE